MRSNDATWIESFEHKRIQPNYQNPSYDSESFGSHVVWDFLDQNNDT
jgi:hypothetical protein